MRPIITFFGLILIIPGWNLVSVDYSDIINQHFVTASGTFLWTLLGSPRDVNLIHLCGLITIIIGILIAIIGIFSKPLEKEKTGSLT